MNQQMIDLWALSASALAAAFFAMRRHMLKPHLGTWAHAPLYVQLSLALMAIVMGAVALSIAIGYHSTQREALTYTALAIQAMIMMTNLNRTGRLKDS